MVDSHEIFTELAKLLFRPLVRFCVKHSLKYQEVLALIKGLLVEEAKRTIEVAGEQVNVSRVAALTGMHRRDVTSLLHQGAGGNTEPPAVRKVLGKWQSDREFLLPTGKPRALGCEGNESEFATLVRSVSKDLNPYTVLFEFERAGTIVRKNGKVLLQKGVFVPAGDARRGFQMVASDVADLLGAVEENVIGRPELPNLHIKTHYDNVSLEALTQIRAWFLERGENLHKEAREYLSKFDKDLNPELSGSSGGARVGIGTFSFTVNPEQTMQITAASERRARRKKK